MLKKSKRRARWLTREEAQRPLSELPDHLAEFANKLDEPVPLSTKLAQLDSGIKRSDCINALFYLRIGHTREDS